mgnify:FL=1
MYQIFVTKKFKKQFKKTPKSVKKQFKNKLKILKNNPFNELLKTHRLQGHLKDFYSFSINYQYRSIFGLKKINIIILHKIGTHEIYK